MTLNFYNDKVCLNVLTQSVENAVQINEITEGNVALGILTASYDTVEEAIDDMKRYQKEVDNNISVGLGNGDPSNWKKVAEVSAAIKPKHINQIFTAVGYTRALVGSDEPFINSMMSPSGKPGFVKINTGELSRNFEDAIVPVETAIAMAKESGANSIKFFPMKGLKAIEELKVLAEACAENDLGLEPTGGINLNNFEEILQTVIDAGVKKIIPHVYSSIIDKEANLTKLEDVETLYEIIKRVTK
ncbi:2-dehydro-3-deoxy-phosphogluconate aldolase [Helcococcus sueciensis]|uniref:2-dehydro-3-deoxy-phosphogluconate aldolase n=1 Tax=Helcococcus sueciensis TaxID=241555 RepID=UPI000415DFC6|nr:KDGP aldolase [Helcococcus sueciensis]